MSYNFANFLLWLGTLINLGFLFMCFYFLKRNDCVYKFRMKILNESYDKYLLLPDYEKMMYHPWWEWNFEKLFREENNNEH